MNVEGVSCPKWLARPAGTRLELVYETLPILSIGPGRLSMCCVRPACLGLWGLSQPVHHVVMLQTEKRPTTDFTPAGHLSKEKQPIKFTVSSHVPSEMQSCA